MDVQQVWIIAAVVALATGLIGFFIGRSNRNAQANQVAETRIKELEADVSRRQTELERHREEIAGYRAAVDTHFDKTASLFVDMAGSYRNLFQHLTSDYDKLSSGKGRERLQSRISALLIEDERTLTPVPETESVAPVQEAMASVPPVTDPPAVEPPRSTSDGSVAGGSIGDGSTGRPAPHADASAPTSTVGRSSL